MMICVVIKGPTFEDAHKQISQALMEADLVELRLDGFSSLDLNALKRLRAQFSIPMIFTLRSSQQGGNYADSEKLRLKIIGELIDLQPEYLDLESHVPPEFIQQIHSEYPETKLILSYHNFENTPEDLDSIYQEMQKIPAHFYKIAVTAIISIDALRLVCWTKHHKDLIGISMGPLGQISRLLAPIIGCPITYAALEEKSASAPGQLTAHTLINRYHHRSLTKNSAIYGLIGDPVERSLSDTTHNALIKKMGLNAIYIKIKVTPSELSDFIHYAKQLPFKGISVTMPLKEHILKHLDDIDVQAKAIGAVNTLSIKSNQITGYNTDGIGALNAIEESCPVKNKRIVILGAGGAAKAIAFEATQRGAHVTILNRHKEKAVELAGQLNCVGMGLDEIASYAQSGYDILINCTPVLPIEPQYILPSAVVMDIVTRPKETVFLKEAQDKGCRLIYGYQMFVEQAVKQYSHWYGKDIDVNQCRQILEENARKVLEGKE